MNPLNDTLQLRSWTQGKKTCTLFRKQDKSIAVAVKQIGKGVVIIPQENINSNVKFTGPFVATALALAECKVTHLEGNWTVNIKLKPSLTKDNRFLAVEFSREEWSTINKLLDAVEKVKDKKVYALAGMAGVGKSTFANAIMGHELVFREHEGLVLASEGEGLFAPMSAQRGEGFTTMATSYGISCSDSFVLDTPGVHDPKMTNVMTSALSTTLSLRSSESVKLIFLIAADMVLGVGRGTLFYDELKYLYENYMAEDFESTLLVFTRPSKKDREDSRDKLIQALKELKEKLQNELSDLDSQTDPLAFDRNQRLYGFLDGILRQDGAFVELYDPIGDLNIQTEQRSIQTIRNKIEELLKWVQEPSKAFHFAASPEAERRFRQGLLTLALEGRQMIDELQFLEKSIKDINSILDSSKTEPKVCIDEKIKEHNQALGDLEDSKEKAKLVRDDLTGKLGEWTDLAVQTYNPIEETATADGHASRHLRFFKRKVRSFGSTVASWTGYFNGHVFNFYLTEILSSEDVKLVLEPEKTTVNEVWGTEKRENVEGVLKKVAVRYFTNSPDVFPRARLQVKRGLHPSHRAMHQKAEAEFERWDILVNEMRSHIKYLQDVSAGTVTKEALRAGLVSKRERISTIRKLLQAEKYRIFIRLYNAMEADFTGEGSFHDIGTVAYAFLSSYKNFIEEETISSKVRTFSHATGNTKQFALQEETP